MIVCWSVKGGSGTTVITAALSLMLGARSNDGACVVDLAGDLPATLGMAEPVGQVSEQSEFHCTQKRLGSPKRQT